MRDELLRSKEEIIRALKEYHEDKEKLEKYYKEIEVLIDNILNKDFPEEKKETILKHINQINMYLDDYKEKNNIEESKLDLHKRIVYINLIKIEKEKDLNESINRLKFSLKIMEKEVKYKDFEDWKEYLVEKLIEELKNTYDIYRIEERLPQFLLKKLKEEKKEKALELIYLYKVYRNGYISLDPRFLQKERSKSIDKILDAENDEELDIGIENLEKLVEMLKEAETNPIKTAKRRCEDKKRYAGCIF